MLPCSCTMLHWLSCFRGSSGVHACSFDFCCASVCSLSVTRYLQAAAISAVCVGYGFQKHCQMYCSVQFLSHAVFGCAHGHLWRAGAELFVIALQDHYQKVSNKSCSTSLQQPSASGELCIIFSERILGWCEETLLPAQQLGALLCSFIRALVKLLHNTRAVTERDLGGSGRV